MPDKLKVLFADDDPDDLALLQEGLREVFPEYDLHYVNHGAEVVAAAKEYKPDLIFLDFNMPDCNGRECLEKLKEDPELKA